MQYGDQNALLSGLSKYGNNVVTEKVNEILLGYYIKLCDTGISNLNVTTDINHSVILMDGDNEVFRTCSDAATGDIIDIKFHYGTNSFGTNIGHWLDNFVDFETFLRYRGVVFRLGRADWDLVTLAFCKIVETVDVACAGFLHSTVEDVFVRPRTMSSVTKMNESQMRQESDSLLNKVANSDELQQVSEKNRHKTIEDLLQQVANKSSESHKVSESQMRQESASLLNKATEETQHKTVKLAVGSVEEARAGYMEQIEALYDRINKEPENDKRVSVIASNLSLAVELGQLRERITNNVMQQIGPLGAFIEEGLVDKYEGYIRKELDAGLTGLMQKINNSGESSKSMEAHLARSVEEARSICQDRIEALYDKINKEPENDKRVAVIASNLALAVELGDLRARIIDRILVEIDPRAGTVNLSLVDEYEDYIRKELDAGLGAIMKRNNSLPGDIL